MADDTLELINPIFENNPQACPKNMLPYESGVLLPKQQKALNATKVPTVRENEQYLHAHPEVNAIVSLLLRAVFANRPKNIAMFMGDFMARPEVEDEIKAYLDKGVDPDIETSNDSPYHKDSKQYHFLNEDQEENLGHSKDEISNGSTTFNDLPDMTKMHDRIKTKKRLKTSISEPIDDIDEDLYKISQISGAGSNATVGLSSLFKIDMSLGEKGLRTLMEPSTGSTRSDSIGNCSFLEMLEHNSKFLSDTENLIVVGVEDDDLYQGSLVGDQWNDEMIMRLAKKNRSGVSAISEKGVFKAVEVEEVHHDAGEKVMHNRRTSLPGMGTRLSYQQEEEEEEEEVEEE